MPRQEDSPKARRALKVSPFKTFASYHLPVIIYAAGVVTLSSIRQLPGPDVELFPVDKVAHFLEYAVFAFLTFRSLSNFIPSGRPTVPAVLSLVFLVIFAGLDEHYQGYVPGRESDTADLIADVCGASLVLAILWLRRRSRRDTGRS
ncbi:MAG: VanZ family protein [Candidatus Zixiibacteriota bacterium]|nr:MAG: VanZ family protein [candidate division Zixibacteria bacterium]